MQSVRRSTFFSICYSTVFLLYILKVIISAIVCTLNFIGCHASRDAAYDETLTERRASSYRSSRKIKYTRYNASDKWVTSYTHVTWWTRTEPQALTEEVPWAKHDIKVFDALKAKNRDSATCGRRNKKNMQVCGSRPPTHTQNTPLISICNENSQKCHYAKSAQFHVGWQQIL